MLLLPFSRQRESVPLLGAFEVQAQTISRIFGIEPLRMLAFPGRGCLEAVEFIPVSPGIARRDVEEHSIAEFAVMTVFGHRLPTNPFPSVHLYGQRALDALRGDVCAGFDRFDIGCPVERHVFLPPIPHPDDIT